MTDDKKHDEVAEYPGGLLENPGGSLPIFLKLTYVGFVLFGIIYFVLYMAGDGSALVEQFNQLTGYGHP